MQGPQKPTRVKSVIPHSEKVVNAEQHEALPLLALALVIRRFLEIADECLQFTRNTPVAHSIYDVTLTVNSICTLAHALCPECGVHECSDEVSKALDVATKESSNADEANNT